MLAVAVQQSVAEEEDAAVHGKSVQEVEWTRVGDVKEVSGCGVDPARARGRPESRRGPLSKLPPTSLSDRRRQVADAKRRRHPSSNSRPARHHAPETTVDQP